MPPLFCILLAALTLAGCADSPVQTPASRPGATPAPVVETAVRGALQPGDTVAVLLRVRSDEPVAGVQGKLRYDTTRLRYLGQPVTAHLVMVNTDSTGTGMLHLAAVRVPALPTDAADLRFVVVGRDPLDGLRFDHEETSDPMAEVVPGVMVAPATPEAGPAPAGAPRMLGLDDWLRLVGDTPSASGRDGSPISVRLLPGDGRIFGDANLTGTVTVSDAVVLTNTSVGNLPLLTLTNRDLAIAGNVAPSNQPGLGEPGDPLPPGRNADGTMSISVTDVVAVQNFTVGIATPVAGQRIPGRPVTPVTARAIIAAPESIKVNRRFSRDTIYEIRGTVVVGDPNVNGQPDVTLTIEAGTRVEFDEATNGRLVVRIGANLVAIGTAFQPIVFTCTNPAPQPGCWGGIHLRGFGLLNNDDFGGIGSPIKLAPGGIGTYGGILIEDSSGVMRNVRIEYAGKPFNGDSLAGLQLLGIGSRTHIDSVQVVGALTDGVYISGGSAQMTGLVITDAKRDALHWADGWVGKVQYLLIRMANLTRYGLHGENFAPDPDAEPRSAPTLANVSIVGRGLVSGGRGIFFENGSAGRVYNSLIYRAAAIGVDVSGQASCNQVAAATLQIKGAIVFDNNTNFSDDVDCVDETLFGSDPFYLNRQLDPQLVDPFVTASPDYRPIFGGAAATGSILLASDGFFRTDTPYIGAAPIASNVTRNNIPWYAGWTRGW